MGCGRCGNNQVGGTVDYDCRRKLEKVRRELDALEECLILAATTPTPPPRPCRCCCCCCHQQGNQTGNQTSWGRCR